MKTINLFLFLILFFSVPKLWSQTYEKTELGVRATANSVTTEIQFYSPEIVRVLKYPEGTTVKKTSLSVIKTPEKTDLNVAQSGQTVTLGSSALEVNLNLETGKIFYSDLIGNVLFSEKDYGIQFTPTEDVNTPSFLARQAFLLEKGEAIYGLGEQQNDKLIQRDERIHLENQNMKICIPYFLSLKGYGIFWDNYSPTTYTDNPQETSFERSDIVPTIISCW